MSTLKAKVRHFIEADGIPGCAGTWEIQRGTWGDEYPLRQKFSEITIAGRWFMVPRRQEKKVVAELERIYGEPT